MSLPPASDPAFDQPEGREAAPAVRQHQHGSRHRAASAAARRAERSPGARAAILGAKILGGVVLALALVGVGLGAWLGTLGLGVKDNLEAAKATAEDIVELAKDRDISGVQQALAAAADHTAEAVRLSEEPIWAFAEGLPIALVSENLVAVRETAAFADELLSQAMPYIEEFLPLLDTSNLKSPDGGFNLVPLQRANEVLPEIAEIVDRAGAQAAELGQGEAVLELITEELDGIRELLAEAQPLLEEAQRLLPAVLPLLGTEGKRNYLLMFQNNAEVRSLGGLPSALALISVNKGKVKLERQASTLDFHACCMWQSNLDLPAEVTALYPANMTRIMGDITMRPDFPTAAKLATNMWKKRYGDRIDAVLSIDPITLSYFLEGTGPIKLSKRDTITADNAIKLLLSEVYTRYHQMDKQGIDDFFANAAKKIFNTLSGDTDTDSEPDAFLTAGTQLREAAKSSGDPYYLRAMARVIGTLADTRGVDYVELVQQGLRAAEEGRVFAYSTKPVEKALIEEFGISGTMLKSNKEQTQIGVFFNDSSVSKLSYYLRTEISITANRCPDNGGRPTITTKVKIRSVVPKNGATTLPVYVKANAGTLKRTGHSAYMRVATVLYGARGGSITSAPGASGYAAGLANRSGVDLGRPVRIVDTTLAPGKSRTLTFVQRLPAGTTLGPIAVRHTAMMKDTPVTIEEKSSCPGDPPVVETPEPPAAPEEDSPETTAEATRREQG